jgi:EAL domain-containing protein (putative c-di-GMP-specific phosphodiesterase class I)
VRQSKLIPASTGLGHVFFWYESWRLAARVRSRMIAAGFTEVPLVDDRVHCFLCDDIETFLPVLFKALSAKEKRQVYALYTDTAKPSLFDFGQLKSIEALENGLSTLWLGDILIDRRYVSLMQPIVSASNHGLVMGYEFLLRGLHTDGTQIPASVLFETAETCEMLYALDMAAGESAARTAKSMNIEKSVFVNVLPRTIGDEAGLDAWLLSVLSASEINTDQIVFELVESQQLSDVRALRRLVDKLHAAGIRVALDDFGSGFNNLVGLIEVEPDFIKLDKSLVENTANDSRKLSLIAGVINTAKQSDIAVIAEGIEDVETAEVMLSVGVDYLQGYFIGYPEDKPLLSN